MATPKWFAVDFLLDTGASTSSLHPLDSIRGAGIAPMTLLQPQQWAMQANHGGIGGSANYFPVQAHYAFQQTDGLWRQLQGDIAVAELTMTNTSVPSLLGWDILRYFKVTVDWAAKAISLE